MHTTVPDPSVLAGAMESRAPEAWALVERAYHFAKQAHEGHLRASGEPYFNHVYAAALELARIGADPQTIAAALLHDTIEDVGIAPEAIEREFGAEVLFLVDGVTKLGQFKYRGASRHTESLRKLLVATSQDVRVLLIKLADRLHNMRTLAAVPKEKQLRIAQETLEIYAPLAHRLGIGVIRRELEDLAFAYVYPKAFEETRALMASHKHVALERLEKFHKELKKELAKNNLLAFRTDYRVKGLYSLWRKLARKEGDIDKIRDIAALRVIVPTVSDCYRVLGIIHGKWRPLPGKIKDFIAFPKPNGYQSLHTTIFTKDEGLLEIQIRTELMHLEAENGIASHVVYKSQQKSNRMEKRSRTATNMQWLSYLLPQFRKASADADQETVASASPAPVKRTPPWIAELVEAQQNLKEPSAFLQSLRSDFFKERLFVFTPKGDVIDLPIESTVVDFAYAIHSDIGNHMAGAFVNNKLVSLDTPLENGDIVRIETKRFAKPSPKWLGYAKTSLARRHIQIMLKELRKQESEFTR